MRVCVREQPVSPPTASPTAADWDNIGCDTTKWTDKSYQDYNCTSCMVNCSYTL